jgi:hypothetical protein
MADNGLMGNKTRPYKRPRTAEKDKERTDNQREYDNRQALINKELLLELVPLCH